MKLNDSVRMKLKTLPAKVGLLVALLLLVATTALTQPAAKPQTTPAQGAEVRARVTETLIDSSIPDDPGVDKMLAIYAPKVHELDNVIGKLTGGELRKGGIGAGSLGNFVTDGILAEARARAGNSIVLAVTNAGGLRKNTIPEGDLRQRDIFELLPFENALVEFDLTGAQVIALLKQVVSHRDAQAGARIKYLNVGNKPQLGSARLLIDGRETEIDPAAIYKIVCIDYLWKRTSNVPSETEGNYSLLGQAKKIEPLGLTIRDAMIHYVKSETAAGRTIKMKLDGRFALDTTASPNPEETRQ